MDRKKILLLEDHSDSRRALKRILEKLGYHIAEAGTVAEGLDQVDGQAFALLDLNLPDGEGTAVCEKIRVHAPQTKVAFVTAAAEPEKTLAMLGSCPDAIFRKPINPDELLLWLRSEGKSQTA